ncbi:MAG: hypothetical protein L0G95_12915, partial [Planococcus sp. (in: firmicutes)]|nr:hypothetical protein [Planococcus sp. (in: firmicutes)]
FEAFIANAQELKRFGYQSGLKESQTNAFLGNVLDRFGQSEPGGRKEIVLYQAVVAEMAQRKGLNNDGALLGFQEDRDTHMALQELPLQERMLACLYLVDGRTLSFVAEVLQIDEQLAKALAKKAQNALCEKLALNDVEELEVRLEFLAKSYKRLKLPDWEMSAEPVETVSEKHTSSDQQVKKPVIWVVGASLVLLAAMIAGSFFIDNFRLPAAEQAEEGQLTREQAKEMEQLYEATRAEAQERLGLDDGQYASFDYVAAADERKEKLFSRRNLQEHLDEPEEFEHQVQDLLLMIETPKGMTEALSGNGTLVLEEIESYMELYIKKTAELQSFAEETLEPYKDQLPAVSEQFSDPAWLTRDITNPSPEFERMLDAWPEYGLRFRTEHPEQSYMIVMDADLLYAIPQLNNYSSAGFLINLLSEYPYFDDSGWLVDPSSLLYSLMILMQLLVDSPTEVILEDQLEVMYEQNFWQLLKGNDRDIYEDGVVKPEIRDMWKSLTAYDSGAAILLPIIEEMEQSEWRQSDALDRLEYGDSLEMLKLEQSGQLAAELPNGDFPLRPELVDLKSFDYSRVKELYEQFTRNYDVNTLANVQPMDIYLLYFYANHEENPEAMWHLQTDSSIKPNLEEYRANWTPMTDLTEEIDWVEITEDSNQRVLEKMTVIPNVSYDMTATDNFQTSPYQLTLVNDSENTWLVQYLQTEFSSGEDRNLEQQGLALYNKIESEGVIPKNASPLSLAYAVLHAVDEENIELAKKLMVFENEPENDDFLDFFANSHKEVGFENMTSIVYRVDDLNIQEKPMGNVEIWYERSHNEQWNESLEIMMTSDGWRFKVYTGI